MGVLSFVSAGLAATAIFTTPAYSVPHEVRSDNQTVPMQVRLAYAGDSGMTVSWNTYSQLSQPSVRYGKHPDHLNKVASSDVSVTYKTSTTYNNHVKITGLEPDTVYWYQPMYGNAAPLSFKTSRRAGDEEPYTVAVVVDLGLMGPDGLTTHVGKGAANPLKPGDNNTMQSLQALGSETEFLWHGKRGPPVPRMNV